MIERPSPLFQPWGLEGIRDLIKRQTRRVMKPQPVAVISDWSWDAEPGQVVIYRGWPHLLTESRGRNKRAAGELTPVKREPPHGQPGDVWYLKEPLHKRDEEARYPGPNSTSEPVIDRRTGELAKWASHWQRDTLSAMYMPRYAARDFVTVKSVRVERLDDISRENCIAEGMHRDMPLNDYGTGARERDSFAELWDSINGKKYPWSSNPWVWVYEFDGYQRDPGRPMEK